MNARWVVGVAALALLSWHISSPAAELEVDAVGDVSKASIEGCKVVPADQVRWELAHDAAVAIAGVPSAPLTEYLNTVQRRLIDAYGASGFARAKVRADVDGQRLRIRVEEGPRLKWRAIRLINAKLTDEAKLRAAMSTPVDRQDTSVTIDESAGTVTIPTFKSRDLTKGVGFPPFSPDAPATLDTRGIRYLVVCELFRQGLCWADPKLDVDEHDDEGVADLVIDLSKEGPKAVLRDVRVTGMSEDTPDEIIAFLGLRAGAAMDLDRLRDVRQKLWDSARFLRHELRADVSREHPGQLDLSIDVFEHPNAPRLSRSLDEALTPAERAAMRLGPTIEQLATADVDYVAEAEIKPLHVRLVFRPRGGAVFVFRAGAAGAATQPAGRRGEFAISVRMGEAGLFCGPLGRKLVAPLPMRLSSELALVPSNELSKESVQFLLGFGFKAVGSDGEGAVAADAPLKVHGVAAPVAFLNFARPRDPKAGTVAAPTTQPSSRPTYVELRDGVVLLRLGEHLTIRTEAATGRLIDLVVDDHANAQWLRVTREAGAFDRELSRLDDDGSLVNEYDPKWPISSSLGFFVAAGDALSEAGAMKWDWQRPVMPVLLKLLAAGVARPLDDVTRSRDRLAADDDFALRSDAAAIGSGNLALARGAIGYVDDVFPHGAWTWTIAHEGWLIVSGGSAHADDELRRIMGGGAIGPVGCLAVAEALRPLNAGTARLAAQVGLSRASAAEFERDVRVLLGNDLAGAKVLANLLQAVSEMSDVDAEQVTHLLPAGGAEALAYLRATHRAHPREAVAAVLQQNPAEWWEKGVRPMVEGELRRLATGSGGAAK